MTPVREALETTRRALIALRTRLKTEPAVQGRGWVDLGIVLNNAVDEADRALSAAPGEPCAWRWRWLTGSERDREWSMWTYSATRPTNTTNKVVEPLYSTPQPVAGWDEAIEASASLLDKKAEMFASLHANALDDHQREDYERRRLNVEAWAKEVRSLRREAPAPAFDLTNHHNALKCPYCNPEGLTFARPDTAEARLRELLSEARQYVADAGDDEDGETKQLSSQLLAEIDKALSAGDEK